MADGWASSWNCWEEEDSSCSFTAHGAEGLCPLLRYSEDH